MAITSGPTGITSLMASDNVMSSLRFLAPGYFFPSATWVGFCWPPSITESFDPTCALNPTHTGRPVSLAASA